MIKNIIGIDLGTTMSVIARIDGTSTSGDIKVIENRGSTTTPSCISFSSGKVDQIGAYAKTHDPSTDVAKLFKKEMKDTNYSFTGGGASHSAMELSSIILEHLTGFASEEVGTITDVVISVPARFGDIERNATREAGKKAGLNVIDIINEPTAAGLAFAKHHKVNGTVLVYDLGGGTFDTTILEINGHEVSEIRNDGNPDLGGSDFDEVMLEIMSEKYASISNEKLYKDSKEKNYILLQAEEIKKELSQRESVDTRLFSEGGSRVKATITRQEFEERTHDKISETKEIIRRLLAEEGGKELQPSDIDTILLVGGGTRMPMIKKLIEKIFGKNAKISAGVNADTAIAEGAALHAAYKMKESGEAVPDGINDFVVNRVSNHSYGMLILDENGELFNCVLIEKNSDIPCVVSEDTSTFYDNQKTILVRITQGTDNSKDPESKSLKVVEEFVFHLQDTDKPKGQPLKTTYSYDGGEVIHCVKEEVNTGHTYEIKPTVK